MRINRLFEIVYLLLDKETMTANELAKRFEVSTRTIYRDIDILSTAGIPIYMSKGKGGGISLLPGYILNKTILTEEEKSGILTSLYAMNSLRPENTDTVLSKLSSLLGEHNSDWIEVDFSNWTNQGNENDIFEQLKTAIFTKSVVTFSYASGKKEEGDRSVIPLKLCFKGQAWYLYGYCKKRLDYRFFKLRRIRNLIVTDSKEECEVPSKVIPERIEYVKEKIHVKIKVQKQMAFRVYDEFESYEVMEDGSFLCTMEVPAEPWIIDYICSFGEYGEVIEPKQLRIDVKERLEKSLKVYL